MLLSSYDGSELELHLSGHRWPNLEGGRQTLYWLKVQIRVLAPFGSIAFQDSCLLDWEADELIQWLKAISRSEAAPETLDFYEGTLCFTTRESHPDEIVLRCQVLAALNRWTLAKGVYRRDVSSESDPFQEIDLQLSRNHLARAAEELKREFELLPIRRTKR